MKNNKKITAILISIASAASMTALAAEAPAGQPSSYWQGEIEAAQARKDIAHQLAESARALGEDDAHFTIQYAKQVWGMQNEIHIAAEKAYAEARLAETKIWTAAEEIMLAKTVWGEARGLPDVERAAVIWTVLNRCDAWGQSIAEVITAQNQFHGYQLRFPATEQDLSLTRDVLARWQQEKLGNMDSGRVLPREYLNFHGDGRHNYFRAAGGVIWDWSLPSPY